MFYNPVPVGSYNCFRREGYGFVMVQALKPDGNPEGNATVNIQNAKIAGFNTGIYLVPSLKKDPVDQVNLAMSQLSSTSYSLVYIRVVSWLPNDENCAFLLNMIKTAQKYGKPVGIYTNIGNWLKVMGAKDACPEAATNTTLWYVNPDGERSAADFTPFGGWQKPTIKTYSRIVPTCDLNIERSWYF